MNGRIMIQENLNLTKEDLIEELKQGKVIRKTCGIWNDPNKRGEICNTEEDIISFFKWAYNVDVYKATAPGIDYDLIGASAGDMF